jgi:cation:H+ antiporter
MAYLLLIGGLAALIISAEFLVRGSAGLALKAKIPPLIVGLTVVSLGTSAPELFASVQAALDGNPGLSIGNVVGSNIANLGLVLGITALIYPIPTSFHISRFDWPAMMLASLAFLVLAFDLKFSRWDGIILLTLLVIFILTLIRRARKFKKIAEDFEPDEYEEYQGKGYTYLLGFCLMGTIGLYFGADWFVQGAEEIAVDFGVSDRIIGLTVVAFGTSVPELVASAIAAFRHETDISIGNLLGSNIFNILAVLGTTAVIQPMAISPLVLTNDVWWMLGIAFIILPFMITIKRIGRPEGLLLLAIYITYVILVIQ